MRRRDFVLKSLLAFGGVSSLGSIAEASAGRKKEEKEGGNDAIVRFGVVTDVHYADKPSSGSRQYTQSLDKLSEAVELMNEQKVDFLIELGDFKDMAAQPEEKTTLQFLETVERVFRQFRGPTYHVLGNHDTDSISKTQFLSKVHNTGFSTALNYYSFNAGPLHFVVLDANYSHEGVSYDHGNIDWKDCHIPEEQLKWLEDDLQRNLKPTIVFVHQNLDGSKAYRPDNAEKVRRILERSGQVPIVFQGHDHKGNFNVLNGIYYYTLKGMIEGSGPENNSYIIVEVDNALNIKIKGYRKAVSKYLVR